MGCAVIVADGAVEEEVGSRSHSAFDAGLVGGEIVVHGDGSLVDDDELVVE